MTEEATEMLISELRELRRWVKDLACAVERVADALERREEPAAEKKARK